MLIGFKHLHSTLAMAVFFGLLLSILFAILNKNVQPGTRKVAKITMILFHVQLLLGLALYFMSDWGLSSLTSGGAMGDSLRRLYAVEHPLVGIIGATLVTIGHAKLKKGTTAKPILIFYTIALLLVLARIPWSTWSWFAS